MIGKEKKTFKISPTSINLMRECPRCFWLEQHGIWKRPDIKFPSLPAGMDKILKNHFDKFIARGTMPPELRENSECSGCMLFNNIELLNKWRDERKGIEWRDSEGNLLHGAIDNLLVKDNKLIVLDYKTRGYPIKDDTHKYYQDQLDIYTFLLRKNGYETEDFAFLLFYVPKEVLETGEVVFDTRLVKIKINLENAEKLFQKAIKLLKGSCPPAKEDCPWCKLIRF